MRISTIFTDQTINSQAEQYRRLDDIFSSVASPGSYYGPEKVMRILKEKGVHDIKKKVVESWLQNQDWYSLHKHARRTFQRAKVRVSAINNLFDADLADMKALSKFNSGVRFLLVVIDVFSRYLWIAPLKNKTASEVVKGFKSIFNKGRKCKKLRTDKGSEFVSKITQAYLKSQDIYFFTTQNSDTKANYAERVIYTIKNLIYRHIEKQRSKRYIDNLQDLVVSYNATPHRSLGNIAPKDVNKTNQDDIWAYQYLNPLEYKKTRQVPYRFNIGDFVRISYNNITFKRSYNEQFSKELFKVDTRFRMQGIPMYKIKDFKDRRIRGNFYNSELLKQNKSEDSLWFIEKRLKKRTKNGKVEFYVKFENWSSEYNMWIPADEIKDGKSLKGSG